MIKERIILAPGANKTELLRSLALHGKGSFGLRIYSSAFNLAQDMLMRKGKLNVNVVSDAETPYIINSCIKTVSAFANASFTDAINIADSLKTLRYLITSDENAQMERLVNESKFAVKNESLLDVYNAYRSKTNGRKDRIDIIREAMNENWELSCEFMKLKEFPLLPLEEALLNKLSGNCVIEKTLADLFEAENKTQKDITYIKAYGNSNEVENTLNYIFEKNISLDDCAIATANSAKYNQLLLEYSQKYNLPMTFSNGTSINNTNPARLLKLYYKWDIERYHGVDPLIAMLYSSCFDMEKLKSKFGKDVEYAVLKNTIDRAGQLKMDSDLEENRKKAENYIQLKDAMSKVDDDVIRVLAEELGRDVASFISEYSIIRDDSNDEEALRFITNALDYYVNYDTDNHYDDTVNYVLSKSIGRAVSKEGSLIVTDIKGALSVCRKHLFVIGLSANNFPGNVKENYLLLDEDIKLYGTGDNMPLSENMIKKKKQSLENLLSLYSDLNADVSLSYSSYDMAEIKAENASSVLFDIFQKQNPTQSIKDFEDLLKKNQTSYLQNKLSVSSMVLNSLEKDQVLEGIPQGDIVDAPYDGKRVFSPTALEGFFLCPKKFYLSSILHIKEPDPDDPLEVIDARDMGTLVHSVMEFKANKKISLDDFKKHAEKMFDDYLRTRTPVNEQKAETARKEFMDMAVNGYENDPDNKVEAAEEKFTVLHQGSGITIYGYPDRVEKDKNGEYLIADYKTKKHYEHEENDIDTCLQVVLYAYLMSHRERNPLPISYCTYRYLRYSKPVNCVYDTNMERKLNDKLLEIKDALDKGHFPCTTVKDNCKYCKFASICGKKDEDKESDENE